MILFFRFPGRVLDAFAPVRSVLGGRRKTINCPMKWFPKTVRRKAEADATARVDALPPSVWPSLCVTQPPQALARLELDTEKVVNLHAEGTAPFSTLRQAGHSPPPSTPPLWDDHATLETGGQGVDLLLTYGEGCRDYSTMKPAFAQRKRVVFDVLLRRRMVHACCPAAALASRPGGSAETILLGQCSPYDSGLTFCCGRLLTDQGLWLHCGAWVRRACVTTNSGE